MTSSDMDVDEEPSAMPEHHVNEQQVAPPANASTNSQHEQQLEEQSVDSNNLPAARASGALTPPDEPIDLTLSDEEEDVYVGMAADPLAVPDVLTLPGINTIIDRIPASRPRRKSIVSREVYTHPSVLHIAQVKNLPIIEVAEAVEQVIWPFAEDFDERIQYQTRKHDYALPIPIRSEWVRKPGWKEYACIPTSFGALDLAKNRDYEEYERDALLAVVSVSLLVWLPVQIVAIQ